MRSSIIFAALIGSFFAMVSTGCGGDTNSNSNQNNEENGDENDVGVDADADEEPQGSAYFVEPEDETVYTNDTVEFEVGIDEGVEDVELFVDGVSLAELDDTLSFSWDTNDEDEGSYQVAIHYSLDGEEMVHDEEREVVVDRTPPELTFSTPAPFSENSLADAPIVAAYDEAIDPESVTTDTVEFSIEGQEMPYSVSLTATGKDIAVEFDVESAVAPYEATLILDGVTDLAGNESVIEEVNWSVPGWLEEAILENPQSLYDHTIVDVDGAEFMVARQTNDVGVSIIKIFLKQPGTWSEIAYSPLFEILDMQASATEDMVYVAFLHRVDVLGSYQRRITVFEFDPVTRDFENLAQIGSMGGDDDTYDGSIAMDLSADTGLIASVSDGVLRVHEFSGVDFSAGENLIPTDEFPNTIPGQLRAHVDDDDNLRVAFIQCSADEAICKNTGIRIIAKEAGGDEWETTANSLYNTNFGINTCDKFLGYDANLEGEIPVAMMSFRDSCPTGAHYISAKMNEDLDTTYFSSTESEDLVPGATASSVFVPQILFREDGDFDVFLASDDILALARATEGDLEWINNVEHDLSPGEEEGMQFSGSGLFRTSKGILAVVNFDSSTHIFRANQ